MTVPPFLGCASGGVMRTDDRTVDNEVFHVGVIDEVMVHTLPYTAFTPSGESFVDAVPITVFGWEHPPLRTSPSNPQYGLNEPPTIGFLPNVQVCLTPKELKYS